jgi:cysteine-rich repeat protein
MSCSRTPPRDLTPGSIRGIGSLSALFAALATAAACGSDFTTTSDGDDPGDSGATSTGQGAGGSASSGDPMGGAGEAGAPNSTRCGGGTLDAGEACDDANTTEGDGCSACGVEDGWACDDASPAHCEPVCGDGRLVGAEDEPGGCDDGETEPDDGCGGACRVETGWFCAEEPSVCAQTCGNGVIDGAEQCDDMNAEDEDGCVACLIEPGFDCDGEPSVCGDSNECAEGSDECDPNATCTNTAGGFVCACNAGYRGDGVTCTAGEAPSCRNLTGTECQGESCCTTLRVEGGTFPFGRGAEACEGCVDGCPPDAECGEDELPERPATVSSFLLDRYEVTVARFRRFALDYDVWHGEGNPEPGAGAHPIAGGGWDPAHDGYLPQTAGVLVQELGAQGLGRQGTWTTVPGDNEVRPINEITYYVAFAFCIYDGGRLPTEAEWEYAAAGGDENRLYPWGSAAIDSTLAGFESTSVPQVGEYAAGAGRWGHRDLAGSVYEWVIDEYGPYTDAECIDCANIGPDIRNRTLRGGSWEAVAANQRATRRLRNIGPTDDNMGLRCARY